MRTVSLADNVGKAPCRVRLRSLQCGERLRRRVELGVHLHTVPRAAAEKKKRSLARGRMTQVPAIRGARTGLAVSLRGRRPLWATSLRNDSIRAIRGT